MNTGTDTLETNTPKTGGGLQLGQSAADLLGFHGTAPTAQRTDASQVAVTDNSTGTVSDTVAAGDFGAGFRGQRTGNHRFKARIH